MNLVDHEARHPGTPAERYAGGGCRACIAAYRVAHREEQRAHTRLVVAAYATAHREQRRATDAAWRAANPEKARGSRARWRSTHLEQAQAQDRARWVGRREEKQAYDAIYRATHPDLAQAWVHQRRARLKGTERESFSLLNVIARDGWRGAICQVVVDATARGRWGMTLDHIVPLSRGGPHTLANSQLAHRSCNSRKGTRDLVGGNELTLEGTG